MTTTIFFDAITGTRLRAGYVASSVRPTGAHLWQQSPPAGVGGFMIKNNSTGVSEPRYRHR